MNGNKSEEEGMKPNAVEDYSSSQVMQVEVQPFTNDHISDSDLMAGIMQIRCCGLLKWELNPVEPHTVISLNFLIIVDKEIFDVHNLALEMDHALSRFTTCSVAIKASGSQTHHYLVGGGGANQASEAFKRREETFIESLAPVEKLVPVKTFFSSLFPLKCFSSPSSKMRPLSLTSQSVDQLPAILEEISTELKLARKEIREVQNHICFLSRHIAQLHLSRCSAIPTRHVHESNSNDRLLVHNKLEPVENTNIFAYPVSAQRKSSKVTSF